MNFPLVSILIPVFNVDLYLARCIDSCLSQSYKNIEIIAVNDGSTDDSGNLLDKLALNESRLKVIHQSNQGVVYAREVALNYAQGDYVCFVDSDDYIEETMISCLIASILEKDCDIVMCGFNIVDNNFQIKGKIYNNIHGESKEDAFKALFTRECSWSLCGKLFKKRLLNKNITMPYGLKVGEDGIVCFQAFENANKFSSLNKAFYNYVQRETSVTHTKKDISLAKSVLNFIECSIKLVENKKMSPQLTHSFHSFIASQLYVFLVYGGDVLEYRKFYRLYIDKSVISLNLTIVEKLILSMGLKSLKVANILLYLRKICL